MPVSEGGEGVGGGWAKPHCTEGLLYSPATFCTTFRFIAGGSTVPRLYLASTLKGT